MAKRKVWVIEGAPTDGASGSFVNEAQAGDLLVDKTNFVTYMNKGTLSVPAWSPQDAGGDVVEVINKTGSEIATDKLVAISGYDVTSAKLKIVLADADAAGLAATHVTTAAIANNASGTVRRNAVSAANLNTNSVTTAGDPVYLSTTAGAFTHAAPTGGDDQVQIVGFANVKSATVGQITWRVAPASVIGANEYQALSVLAAAIAAGTITEAKLEPGSATAGLTALVVKFLANAAVIGGIPVLFEIAIADASADTDVVSTHKIKVDDFWFVSSGIAAHAANDTIQLKNGTNAISDAIAKTATVEKVVRASTLVAAQRTIAAGGTIRVTAVKDTNVAGTAYVLGHRVA